jgi:hypothetical protein
MTMFISLPKPQSELRTFQTMEKFAYSELTKCQVGLSPKGSGSTEYSVYRQVTQWNHSTDQKL